MIFRSLFEANYLPLLIIVMLLLTMIIWAFGKNMFKLIFSPPVDFNEEKVEKIKPYESLSQFIFLGLVVYLGLNPPVQFVTLMKESQNHCVNYFGVPFGNKINLFCCIANDEMHSIFVSSCVVDASKQLPSFTAKDFAFEKFERELNENFGIKYTDHPWLKPVRFSFNRSDKNKTISNYPFFKIESEELHEVGVGPIHAGVIEPGHFRFICNGEQILHLEIQLGYQHRGIEQLFLAKKKLLQRTTLAENIAGDTVAGHTIAFANCWENLSKYPL